MEKFSPGRPDRNPSDPGAGGAAIRTPSKGDSSSPGSLPTPSDSPTLIDHPASGSDSSDSPTLVNIPSGAGSDPSDSPTLVDHGASFGPDAPTMIGSTPWQAPSAPAPRAPRSEHQSMLQAGQVLGQRYEIQQILGEGGMGAVYKARDRELNRMVALKVIRPELAGSQAIIDRFKQELLLATQVTHKNVIRIYDLSEADGMKFITMEFVEGEDLRSLMQQKTKLSPAEAVEIMLQVCRALEAAHSVGIIHRDLKPQNIMRDKAGRILVMDFGLARTLEGDGMTQTGALIGTMDYMSPEQALGKELDERSDLFTLGLIFYELLTGKMPYKADSAVASLLKRTQERAAPVSSHDATIPRPLSDIVGRCMDPDVKMRYESSSQIMADLEAWQGGRAAATLTFPSSSKPWGQTIPWPWIGGIAAALVLAIVGFLFRGALFGPSTKAPTGPVVSLAILPFRNASGDPSVNWMGATVAQMLSSDMGESASLRTVPSDRVNQILRDQRVAPDATLDPDTLRRVAEFTGADRLLWGQYLKLGDQIRIDATLQDLKQQRNFALKAEAGSEKDLPKALEQLAQSVQNSLSLSAETIKELREKTLKPSSQSVQALRYYTEGVQLARQGKNLDAVQQFESAIKEDPNFALSYSKLGTAYAALGYGDKAQENSRKALDLSDRVSVQEKDLILAENARVNSSYAKAIEFYEKLAEILPQDSDVQYSLARLYDDTGSLDKAQAYYDKLLSRDPKNVDALLHMGTLENRRNNPQGSLDYLNRGLTIAVQLGNDEEKAAILDAIGNTYNILNKQDEAIRSYQDALEVKKRLGDKGGVASTLNFTAQAQATMGKPELALKNFQQALSIRREMGDKQGQARNLTDLGALYESLGQYDQALKSTKEALPFYREVGDRQNEAVSLNNIGWFYFEKGDYEDAIAYSQQALEIKQKVGSPADIAETLYNLGEIFSRTGLYSQGVDYYLKALDLWRKAGDKRGVAFASYGLSKAFQSEGRYGAALTSAEDALKGWREINEPSVWLAEIQGNYGNALTLMGRSDEAAKNLEEALAKARELKNNTTVSHILNIQGDRMLYRGDLKAARSLFEQASHLAAGTGDRELILRSKLNIVSVTVKEGRPQEAIRQVKSLLEEADRSGLKSLSAECSLNLAEALIGSKNYSGAHQELERSLRNSEKLGQQVLLARSHYLWGEALRLSGNQTEASRHYAEAGRILDEVRKEARSDDVLKGSDLATIYQAAARWGTPKT
jgi:tetratricopeptide (TPR) repeat protein/predicted Ser/Thr protein kinase